MKHLLEIAPFSVTAIFMQSSARSQPNCQYIHAQQVLIADLFSDLEHQMNAHVFTVFVHLHHPDIGGRIKGPAVVPQPQDDLVSLMDHPDIHRMGPVVLPEPVQNHIPGHFLHAQAGKRAPPGIYSPFRAEGADLPGNTHHLVKIGYRDIDPLVGLTPMCSGMASRSSMLRGKRFRLMPK